MCQCNANKKLRNTKKHTKHIWYERMTKKKNQIKTRETKKKLFVALTTHLVASNGTISNNNKLENVFVACLSSTNS